MPEPYTGWRVVNDATTIEQLGWTEVLDPGELPSADMPRKFVKINGGIYDFLWQPANVGIVALAYRIGYSDGALGALGVRPRYEFERDRA